MLRSRFLWQLSGALAAIILVSTLVFAFVASSQVQTDARNTIRASLVTQAAVLRQLLLPNLLLDEAISTGELAAITGDPGQRITLIDARGVVLADSREDPEVMDNHGRRPEIVDALGTNPLTGRAVIERILNFIGASEVAENLDGQRDESAITDQEAEAALRAVLGDDMGRYVKQLVEEKGEDITEEQIQELQQGNLFQLVQQMSVFQKIQIGRMGNKEARSLLVRDRNKLVAISVATSPKITESEIIGIAQSRNVCDEVYRVIAMNREWTRNYQVKLALAANPKCPQSMAVKFVNYLHDKDLRTLMRSRDVSRVISTHARRILSRKGKV